MPPAFAVVAGVVADVGGDVDVALVTDGVVGAALAPVVVDGALPELRDAVVAGAVLFCSRSCCSCARAA